MCFRNSIRIMQAVIRILQARGVEEELPLGTGSSHSTTSRKGWYRSSKRNGCNMCAGGGGWYTCTCTHMCTCCSLVVNTIVGPCIVYTSEAFGCSTHNISSLPAVGHMFVLSPYVDMWLQAFWMSVLIGCLGGLLVLLVAFNRVHAFLKPMSEVLQEKLKYISLPDHRNKTGYQNEVTLTPCRECQN